MKSYEVNYIESLRKENVKLREELAGAKQDSMKNSLKFEILAKRVQREMLERIANTPADEKIDFDELANQVTVNASDISDICGVILIEAQQKVNLHNQETEQSKKEGFFGKARS